MEHGGTVLIQVISSTTGEGRFSERTAHWVGQFLHARDDFDVEQIDLREYPLEGRCGKRPAEVAAGKQALDRRR